MAPRTTQTARNRAGRRAGRDHRPPSSASGQTRDRGRAGPEQAAPPMTTATCRSAWPNDRGVHVRQPARALQPGGREDLPGPGGHRSIPRLLEASTTDHDLRRSDGPPHGLAPGVLRPQRQGRRQAGTGRAGSDRLQHRRARPLGRDRTAAWSPSTGRWPRTPAAPPSSTASSCTSWRAERLRRRWGPQDRFDIVGVDDTGKLVAIGG